MGFIYALKLKNGKEYRYIGKTINLQKRFKEHRNSASRGENLPVYRWIRSKGIENIEMIVLAEGNDSDLASLEIDWIAKIKKSKHTLLNITDGGEGAAGYRHSEKIKKKWSKERKGSISGPKNPNYGKFGPDHPAYGRKLSKETKKKLSEQKMGEGNPNYGKQMSEETKQKMSLAQKGKPKPSSSISAHTRYHVKMNKYSEKCKWCNSL